MSEIVFEVTEDAADGGYVARSLGFSIVTQAGSIEELKEMIRDAVRCHFESEEARPNLARLHFVRDEILAAHHGTSPDALLVLLEL